MMVKPFCKLQAGILATLAWILPTGTIAFSATLQPAIANSVPTNLLAKDRTPLKNLVTRYSSILVQPSDSNYQKIQQLGKQLNCESEILGNRSVTRYQLALVLQGCLDQVNQKIMLGDLSPVDGSPLLDKPFLLGLQQLQEEFAKELAHLRLPGFCSRICDDVNASDFSITPKDSQGQDNH